MAALCSECGGSRWVRYFSETTDGNVEEAFRLCPCNYDEREMRDEHIREEQEHAGIAAGEPASPLDQGAFKPCIEPQCQQPRKGHFSVEAKEAN